MIVLAPGTLRGGLFAFGVVDGVFTDPTALDFEIVRRAPGGDVVVVARTPLVVGPSAPKPGRAGVGRYVVPWDVPNGAPAGVYALRVWRTQSDDVYEVLEERTFEVYPVRFRREVYGSPTKLRAGTPSTGMMAISDAAIAQGMERAADLIDKLTRRFFVPRWLGFEHVGDPLRLLFRMPIIAIDRLEALNDATFLPSWDFAGGEAIIYNRHLGGLIDPDDRDAPRIEYRGIFPFSRRTPRRASARMKVFGLFGYTDPDGTLIGDTPSAIVEVAENMAVFFARGGQLGAVGNAYGIASESTREQSVSYKAGGGSTGFQFVGALTGNPSWDSIISAYAGPPQMGAV